MKIKTKELLKNELVLVGDVRFGASVLSIPLSPAQRILNADKFLLELQNLMIKYEVPKIDIAFDIFHRQLLE